MELRSFQNARRVSNGKWVPVKGITGLTFIIEPYQRGYRWGKNNVKKLLEDIDQYVKESAIQSPAILRYIEENCEEDDKTEIYDFYCLQALSIQQKDEVSFELIDGQQRLTTLFLIDELLDAFINPKEYRSEDAPYSIVYQRSGDNKNAFDLTKAIHTIIPYDVDGENPGRAYRKGFGKRDAYWYESYKSALINGIRGLQQTNSIDSLAIDLYYMGDVAEEVIDFIYSYRDDPRSIKNLDTFVKILRQNVLFLWYEIPSVIKAEDEFASLNSNKIKLTNAELIKALVLKTDDSGNVFENAGHRWETIEQGLCQNELWAFISGIDKATRIDLILDLFARSQSKPFLSDPNNENALFDWYESLRQKTTQKEFSRVVITGIEAFYNRICEWYDDVDLYHYIGLLTCFRGLGLKKEGDKPLSQEELITKVFSLYNQSENKAEFIIKLKEEIKAGILHGIKNEEQPETVEDLLDCFSYDIAQHRANLQAILWLVNAWETIESAVNNKSKNERSPIVINRLPFSQINGKLLKTDSWTLEHIMPQNPEEKASEDEKKSFQFLMDEIKEKGVPIIESDDIHGIGNMALLTHSTNSSISNGTLEEKRYSIIKKMGSGEYIPGSTVNAFCLYYNVWDEEHKSTKYEERFWTITDRDSYLKQIKNCLCSFGFKSENQVKKGAITNE